MHNMGYSPPIEQLIQAFSKLPTVGRRTAERFVFYLLKSGKKDVGELTLALKDLIDSIKSCEKCFIFSDTSPCVTCSNTKRDNSIICVVAEPQDMQAIEKTNTYNGLYHILRGTLKAESLDAIPPHLKIKELLIRIKNSDVKEVILALNPDMSGETTMIFLERQLKKHVPHTTISRLARGLPMGSDLQYADDVTLQSALENRVQN